MSDNLKYYYMRLKEDFFEGDEIKILEGMPNGYKYSNLILKLYLKSLKLNGALRLNEYIPYDPEMIASVCNMDIDTVRVALGLYQKLGLVEILGDGTIYMLQIQALIGKSSTEADRKMEYRRKIETEKMKFLGQMSDECPEVVRTDLGQCPPEIEIELEKELEIEKPSMQIGDLRARYSVEQQKVIDNYLDVLKWTRQKGKIADSVILGIYKEWEKFAPEKVIYALQVYINNPKYHDKKENYCYGIMRNATSEEVAGQKGAKKDGRDQFNYDDLSLNPDEIFREDK